MYTPASNPYDAPAINPSAVAAAPGIAPTDDVWQPASEIDRSDLEELQRASQQFCRKHTRDHHGQAEQSQAHDVLGQALLKVAGKLPPPVPDAFRLDSFPETSRPAAQPDARSNEFNQAPIRVASAGDRRGLPRRPGKSGTRALLSPGKLAPGSRDWAFHATAQPARLVDLCLTGAAFLTDSPYDVGSELGIRFEAPDGQPVCDRQGRILRVLQLGTRRWKIVCQLGRALDQPQLAELSMHVFQSNLI